MATKHYNILSWAFSYRTNVFVTDTFRIYENFSYKGQAYILHLPNENQD